MNYQHEAGVEWMSASTNSTATKMEVIEEEGEEDEKKRSSLGVGVVIEREHMFDKVVTPSDVGKLNRLVIPKQHAEKYFPLDSTNQDKGLLLNFEDGTGKPWRFRYSYWNSSQSYVMTKGWSRFVKEKKLDAGDIVSFQRGVGVGEFGKDKLFIDWRRRPDPHHHLHGHSLLPHFPYHHPSHGRALVPPPPPAPPTFAVLRSHPYTQPSVYPYPQPAGRRVGSEGGSGYYGYGYGNVVNPYPVTGSLIFLRSSSAAATPTTSTVQAEEEQNVYDSVPVVQGKATAKRLRLFGVNMECTPISHPSHDFDILSPSFASSSSSPSSSIINNHHHHHYPYHQHATSISMGVGPPTPTSITSTTTSLPLQRRSFMNGTSSIPSEKGKSSTSSSSMSLDLDI